MRKIGQNDRCPKRSNTGRDGRADCLRSTGGRASNNWVPARLHSAGRWGTKAIAACAVALIVAAGLFSNVWLKRAAELRADAGQLQGPVPQWPSSNSQPHGALLRGVTLKE